MAVKLKYKRAVMEAPMRWHGGVVGVVLVRLVISKPMLNTRMNGKAQAVQDERMNVSNGLVESSSNGLGAVSESNDLDGVGEPEPSGSGSNRRTRLGLIKNEFDGTNGFDSSEPNSIVTVIRNEHESLDRIDLDELDFSGLTSLDLIGSESNGLGVVNWSNSLDKIDDEPISIDSSDDELICLGSLETPNYNETDMPNNLNSLYMPDEPSTTSTVMSNPNDRITILNNTEDHSIMDVVARDWYDKGKKTLQKDLLSALEPHKNMVFIESANESDTNQSDRSDNKLSWDHYDTTGKKDFYEYDSDRQGRRKGSLSSEASFDGKHTNNKELIDKQPNIEVYKYTFETNKSDKKQQIYYLNTDLNCPLQKVKQAEINEHFKNRMKNDLKGILIDLLMDWGLHKYSLDGEVVKMIETKFDICVHAGVNKELFVDDSIKKYKRILDDDCKILNDNLFMLDIHLLEGKPIGPLNIFVVLKNESKGSGSMMNKKRRMDLERFKRIVVDSSGMIRDKLLGSGSNGGSNGSGSTMNTANRTGRRTKLKNDYSSLDGDDEKTSDDDFDDRTNKISHASINRQSAPPIRRDKKPGCDSSSATPKNNSSLTISNPSFVVNEPIDSSRNRNGFVPCDGSSVGFNNFNDEFLTDIPEEDDEEGEGVEDVVVEEGAEEGGNAIEENNTKNSSNNIVIHEEPTEVELAIEMAGNRNNNRAVKSSVGDFNSNWNGRVGREEIDDGTNNDFKKLRCKECGKELKKQKVVENKENINNSPLIIYAYELPPEEESSKYEVFDILREEEENKNEKQKEIERKEKVETRKDNKVLIITAVAIVGLGATLFALCLSRVSAVAARTTTG